jgi:hypothetical protein
MLIGQERAPLAQIWGQSVIRRDGQELPVRIAGPPTETGLWLGGYGNVVLSYGGENHASSGGLPGGSVVTELGRAANFHRVFAELCETAERRLLDAAITGP